MCNLLVDGIIACPSCSSVSVFPKLSVKVEGIEHTIEPENYIETNGTVCAMFILENKVSSHVILGSPFMRDRYMVFDKTNKKIAIHTLEVIEDPEPIDVPKSET